MEFALVFSILSAIGALFFFAGGFCAGRVRVAQLLGKQDVAVEHDWAAREAALRDSIAQEMARSESARMRANTALSSTNLDAECARLRIEASAAAAEITHLKATLAALEHRSAEGFGSLQPAAIESTPGATSFQGILGRLVKTKGLRAAVLGDALGLPVASLGEQSESLAGCCGFISQAAGKARDFLQLGGIRRIVIEDDRLATLTACSVAGTDIFLATLTTGPGPEHSRMIQVLNDVKSFMSQRSPS